MSKLTLSVDDQVATRAKQYAKRSGTSVSAMVQTYLSAVVVEPNSDTGRRAPVLRSVRGILKQAGIEDYRQHLATKYR